MAREYSHLAILLTMSSELVKTAAADADDHDEIGISPNLKKLEKAAQLAKYWANSVIAEIRKAKKKQLERR